MGEVELNEMFQAMVAAIRNEDNTDNLKLVNTNVHGKPTATICWVDYDENGKIINVNPMAILITPEVFKMVDPIIEK